MNCVRGWRSSLQTVTVMPLSPDLAISDIAFAMFGAASGLPYGHGAVGCPMIPGGRK